MAYHLLINVTSPSIFSSLKKILGTMDGVTVENMTKSKKKSATDAILADKELMSSIKRGEKDLSEGHSKTMTAVEINNLLGL